MRAAVFLIALALAGCHPDRTEMVVRVTANGLSIPADVDALRVVVTDRGQEVWSLPATPFCTAGQRPTKSPPECLSLPVVATLFPGPTQPHDPVQVEVIAYAGPELVIDDAATFTFADGVSQLLDFVLYPKCLKTDCAHDAQPRSCTPDGSCAPLLPQPLASEPPLDGGVVPDDLAVADAAPADAASPPKDLSSPLIDAGSATGVTFVKSSSLVRGAGGTMTIGMPSTLAGDLLVAIWVVCAASSNTTWTAASVASSCGGVIDPMTSTSVPCTVHLAYQRSTGGNVTFSLTYNSGAPVIGLLSQWRGTSMPPLDLTAQSTSASAYDVTVTTGGKTASPSEVAIDVVCEVRSTATLPTITPGAGWTSLGTDSDSLVTFATDYLANLTAQTTVSEKVTSTIPGNWGAGLVTLY